MFDKEFVDTDSPEIRTKRGKRQFELEKNLSAFNGLSYIERFFLVRDTIFDGMKNIQGTELDTLISNAEVPDHISRELVANEYLPAFVRYIDSKEDELVKIESENRAELGFRLAILVYFLSITIHQSVDGNTQSANIISLSYLRQFCPKYENSYFPIKYTQEGNFRNYLSVPFPKFDSTHSPNMSEEDQLLCDYISEIRKLVRTIDDSPAEFMQDNDQQFEEVATQKLNTLLKLIQQKSGFSFSDLVYQQIRKNEYSLSAHNARSELAGYLNKKYPRYTVSVWGVASDKNDKIAQQKHLLSTTLVEPEGEKFLNLYIKLGGAQLLDQLSKMDGDSQVIQDLITIAKTLMAYEIEFERVLSVEDKASHQSQYDKST